MTVALASPETRMTAADLRQHLVGGADRAVLVLYEPTGASTRVVEILDGEQLTIGRTREASLRIDCDRVSRLHARISRRGGELVVEDLGSRNQTWVNGVAVTAATQLRSGDEIAIGPASIVVSVTSRVIARPDVASSRRLEEQLTAELDRCRRYRRSLALVMVRLHGDAAEADAAVDRIGAVMRPMDLLAEYSSSELALVLPELDAAGATVSAREIGMAARTRDGAIVDGLDVAIGVAVFPAHGTTAGQLIARARAAVGAMRNSGAHDVGVPPSEPAAVAGIVGDAQMRRVYELVRKVADHPITVLIRGETGVGKEVVAAAIHRESQRRAGPLVRLNCASLPETLLESELFGHERGSFTGAERRKQGYFEVAGGGTLFLDEIGELTPATQAKLLRVLEDRRITRVGGTEEIDVDVRVVCATHRDLEAECARAVFRSDLYFRISAFTILVPPLRDRRDEIVLLARHFLEQAGEAGRRGPELSARAVAAIRAYAWPGNVRELRNAIERACVVRAGAVIEVDDLPDAVREARSVLPAQPAPTPATPHDVRERIAALERAGLVAALEVCLGNQTEAAKRLGLTRRTLIYRMEKHGLKTPPATRR